MIWSSFSRERKTEEKLTSPIKKKRACLKCDCCWAYREREDKIKKKAKAFQAQYKDIKGKMKEMLEKKEEAPKPPSLKVKLDVVVKWMEELLEKNLEFDQSSSDYGVFINRKNGMFHITPEGEVKRDPGFYFGPEFKPPQALPEHKYASWFGKKKVISRWSITRKTTSLCNSEWRPFTATAENLV